MDTKNNGKKEDNRFKDRFTKFFTPRKKEPNFILSIFVTCLKLFVITLLIIGFAGFGAVLGVAKAYVDGTPALDIDQIEDQNLTSFIYDKNGDLITEYNGLEYRIWAPISEIPKTVQNALIATEDVRFYAHNGLDYKRLAGAFVNNLRNESVQGGSTITQQLIKNTLLSAEQTYKRKIQEAYLSIQLEQEYDKNEILEAYLNTIYLGSGNYGIKAAALNYFGKELDELTLRESAALVGITKNPYRYDLRLNFYNRESPEISYGRTNLVLRLMYENGYISKNAYEDAKFDDKSPGSPKNDGFVVLEESNHQQLYDHPYFVEYAIYDLIDELTTLYGWDNEQANDLIQSGGLKVYTTMDPEIQTTLEDTLYNYKNYPGTKKAKDNVKREKIGDRIINVEQPQAAAVVLDHTTGELKALVGGRSDPQARFWKNRADMSWAPGSSIKPLSVYAPYIEAGYPGGYIIEDVPVPIKGWNDGGGKGYPSNYNTKKFYGPVTAKKAVQQSYNVSSARTLLERVGVENSKNKLKELGITSAGYVENGYASNLSLGSDPINLIEITSAYGALANKGVYTEPTSISKVYDRDNNLIIDNSKQPTMTVFKESTAFIMTDWLQNVVANGTGTEASFKGMPIAGKTGTNDEHKGVFFAGYTPYYTASVVIAHDYNASLEDGSTGGKAAAPLWKAFMKKIHENLKSKPFYESKPKNVKSVEVCAVSGLLACDECPETVTEYFPADAVPTEKCNMHKKITICDLSGKLPSPFCPESHLITKSVVVIPKDSIYQKLSDEELEKIIPGAFRSLDALDELDELDYTNPEQKDRFCQLHNSTWNAGEVQKKVLTEQADQLISQITENMNRYGSYLTQSQKDALNNAIDSLLKSLTEEPLTPPKKGEPYYTEIPSFQPEAVQTEMNKLQKTYESVFNTDLWNKISNNGNAGEENIDDDDVPNTNNGNGNNGNSVRRNKNR